MITVRLQETGSPCHEDIVFAVAGLTEVLSFDSYYFGIELDGMKDEETSIAEAIAILLDDWVIQLNKMQDGEAIYLPIDFSDEYIGCMKAEANGGYVAIGYGCIRENGYAVSPMSPRGFYKSTKTYIPDLSSINILMDAFCEAIKKQADNLRNQK